MGKVVLVVLLLAGSMSVSPAQASEYLVAALEQVKSSEPVTLPQAACKKVFSSLASKKPFKAPAVESWTDGMFEESDGLVIVTFASGVTGALVYYFCM